MDLVGIQQMKRMIKASSQPPQELPVSFFPPQGLKEFLVAPVGYRDATWTAGTNKGNRFIRIDPSFRAIDSTDTWIGRRD